MQKTAAAITKAFPGLGRMRVGYAISFLLQDNLLTRGQVSAHALPCICTIAHIPAARSVWLASTFW